MAQQEEIVRERTTGNIDAQMNGKDVLDKMTTRSIIGLSLTGFLGFVLWYVLTHTITSDSQLMLLVLGILTTNFTTVVIFYFRKNPKPTP